MTYFQDFPASLTQGIIAPGWVNVGASAFIVRAGGFGEASATNGHAAVQTGNGVLTDQELIVTGTLFNAENNVSFLAGILRCNATLTAGYLINLNPFDKTAVLQKIPGFAQIGATLHWAPPATGHTYIVTYQAVGNQLGFSVNGQLFMPQDWVDNSYAAGYCGLRYSQPVGSAGAPASVSHVTIDSTVAEIPKTRLTRFSNSPIIKASGTYDGIVAAGVVPYSWWWDTTNKRFLCACGFASGGKAYSMIYTSPDLVNFAYVAGSLMAPQGTDTIIEIVGLLRIPRTPGYGANQGKYLATGLHYGAKYFTTAWISDTLTGFQAAGPIDNILAFGAAGSGDHEGQFDQYCVVNPISGKIELWYGGFENGLTLRSIMMADTSDLVTWTKHGVQLSGDTWDGAGNCLGAVTVIYTTGPDGSPNARWMGYDAAAVDGYRVGALAWAKYLGGGTWGPFRKLGPNIYQVAANSWESVTVFGQNLIGPFDRGDGAGTQFYINYTGQNSQVTGLVTNSGIGLARMPVPTPVIPQRRPPLMARSYRHIP